MQVTMDDYDILTALQNASDISYVELGQKFNVSDVAIRKRVKKLRKQAIMMI
ncbi:MAG: AsnC family protein [Candidatus Heimdallarchaeota archaeon]|nr:MAG: AsnC family protein [Candidatus Heimdallarchaeota archaeon]